MIICITSAFSISYVVSHPATHIATLPGSLPTTGGWSVGQSLYAEEFISYPATDRHHPDDGVITFYIKARAAYDDVIDPGLITASCTDLARCRDGKVIARSKTCHISITHSNLFSLSDTSAYL